MNARYRYPLYLFYIGKVESPGPLECKICKSVIQREKARSHMSINHRNLLEKYAIEGKVRLTERKTDDKRKTANALLRELRTERGNKCFDCGIISKFPEFHKLPAPELEQIIKDLEQTANSIRDNPERYVLLCKKCHRERHAMSILKRLSNQIYVKQGGKK